MSTQFISDIDLVMREEVGQFDVTGGHLWLNGSRGAKLRDATVDRVMV